MIRKIFPFIFCVLATISYAQETQFEKIKKLFYEEYLYEKVIQLSNDLINSSELSDSLRIDLYLMRGASFYALENNSKAREDVESILRLNRNYSPTNIPAKVISFFNEVKAEFIRVSQVSETTPEDVAKIIRLSSERESKFKNAAIKNILIPGWGQAMLGSTTKGLMLGGLSVINLTAMIYYALDASTKQNAYLKETNKLFLEEKYSAYNNSYKTRNALIISYAALWIYSQIDIHFLSDVLPDAELQSVASTTGANSILPTISVKIAF